MRFRASLPKEQREIVPITMVKEGQEEPGQEEPGQEEPGSVNADAPTTDVKLIVLRTSKSPIVSQKSWSDSLPRVARSFLAE